MGPAGTGKTYLAVAMALSMLASKRVKRLVLTRPAVEAGEKLGFLPGDMEDKVNPYLRPLYDALGDMPRGLPRLPLVRRPESLKSRRWLSCAGVLSTTPFSFWMKPRTPPASR